MSPPTKRISVASGVLGIWLLTSPFVLGALPIDRWNDLVVGGSIAALTGYNYSRTREQGESSQRVSGVLLLFGVWLLFAPFVNDVTGIPRWNDVIVGVLVTAFAGYNAYFASLDGQSANRTVADDT